jgi:signal transduction histidine kinase
LLSSAGLHLNAFTSTHKTDADEITKTKSILKEAHDQIRDLSHELMPTLLSRFGLFYALEDLCEKNSNSVLQFKCTMIVPALKGTIKINSQINLGTTVVLNVPINYQQKNYVRFSISIISISFILSPSITNRSIVRTW